MKRLRERIGETSHTFSKVIALLFERFQLRKYLQCKIRDVAGVVNPSMMPALERQTS